MLERIEAQLARLRAHDVKVSLSDDFEPEAGTLVRVELGPSYWHLIPAEFLQLLEDLPDQAGSEEVKVAIEKKATTVWHGPAPEGSRDTSA